MLELELPLAEDGGGGGVQWHIAKLRALREQMHEEDLVCPMLWIPKGVCEDICPNKLLDLLNFAPNDWDSITCALVIISRGVLLGEKSYADMQVALQECRAAMTWPKDSEPQCRLLVRYHAAMAHVVDATWIMAACLHFGLPVRTVLDSMRLTHRFVPRVSALRVQDQAAVAAVRSLTLQIVHYTLWPSLMDERKPVFKEALESATCAMALAPEEGVWLTLYARCLPWTDTRKSILLQAGFNLHKTPFTVIEYASYLSHSGYAEAVDEAAKLCEMAIRLWPDSVFVNSNYVTLFLNSNCRAKLSLATADECLRRARNLAPDSPMLAGHRWNLRDVHRAGGQLSPILEEGEDVLADVGCWSPEKEQRLLAIAACLYPTALLQLQHLSRPVQAQQPGPAASVEQHPDEAAAKGPDTLWSPKIKKKFADPAGRSPPPSPSPDLSKPCPTALNVPPPDSEPDPSPFPSATAEHDPSEHTSTPSSSTPSPVSILTPSPSPTPPSSPSPAPSPPSPPPARLPGKPLRMRTPPISGPLRRPRTPVTRFEEAPSRLSTPVTSVSAATETSAAPPCPPPCPPPCVPPPPEFRDAPPPVAEPVAAAPSPSAPSRRRGFPAQSPPPEAFARTKIVSPVTARSAAPVKPPVPEPSTQQCLPAEPLMRCATEERDLRAAVTEPSAQQDLRAAVTEPSVVEAAAPLVQFAPAVQDLRAPEPSALQDLRDAVTEPSTQDLQSATLLRPSSPVSPIVPPDNLKVLPVPEGAPPLTDLLPPSYFVAPFAPVSKVSSAQAPVERLDAALPPQPKKVELGTPSKPVSRVFSAQARLERLSASLSSRPEKAEEGSPASVKPDSRPPALEHLDLVPPLEVEPASVSPPEGNAGKTATSVAATAGSLPSAWNGAPSPPKSSLRPTAPAWVPPSMRPSGQARGLMPPRPRSPSASMRPVALPTPPQSPPSKSAWSDFLVGQSYIQPPMQYKCPAQGRFDRLKMPKLNEVKAEVQVKPGDAAPNCDDFHWEGKLFDALCTGNPVPVSNGNHVPVKLEVPSSDRDQKVSDLDGFTTPPYMEGSYDARKNILPSVKEECHSDTERKGVSARLKLSNKFAEENSDQNKAAPIGAPVSRPVVLICDDKSMSTIPNDLFTCQSNRSDSQVSGPVNSLGQSANAVTGHSRQEPAGKSRGQSQVNHTTYTNCGWSNQQKPSAQSAAELAASHSFVVASPCVVVTPLQSGVGLTPLRSFAAPTSGLAPLSVLGPAPPAPPCSSYGMPSPAPNFAPYFSAPRPASNFAPHFSAPRPPSNFAPHFSAPRPASNFAPHFSAPRPASNFAPHFSAPRPASNFAPDFSAAPRPAPNFGALPSGPNFAAPPSAPNFAVPQPPASKAVSQPPAASKAVPQPPAASKAVPQPAPASKAVPQPPAASKAAPPPATDAEASRPSVCADALAEVRGLIEEADACPRPQSPAWETVRARRPHLSRAASPSGPARSRTSSPAGRFSVLSTESPTSSGCSSRATSPARTDRKTDVPLWRRGGGDADASIKTSGEWVHWKTATTTTANPSTPSCPSTESVPPAQAQRDAPVSLRPEAASAKPAAPPLPVCNCVCSSDCIIATYKYYRDLRPGPHVERRCLKKGLLNGALRPRLSSRLVIN